MVNIVETELTKFYAHDLRGIASPHGRPPGTHAVRSVKRVVAHGVQAVIIAFIDCVRDEIDWEYLSLVRVSGELKIYARRPGLRYSYRGVVEKHRGLSGDEAGHISDGVDYALSLSSLGIAYADQLEAPDVPDFVVQYFYFGFLRVWKTPCRLRDRFRGSR